MSLQLLQRGEPEGTAKVWYQPPCLVLHQEGLASSKDLLYIYIYTAGQNKGLTQAEQTGQGCRCKDSRNWMNPVFCHSSDQNDLQSSRGPLVLSLLKVSVAEQRRREAALAEYARKVSKFCFH